MNLSAIPEKSDSNYVEICGTLGVTTLTKSGGLKEKGNESD